METFDAKVRVLMQKLKMPACSTLQQCVALTQAAWLRPAGSERWNIKESSPELQALLMPYFKDLQLVDAIYPTKSHYTYGVLHGAVLLDFRDTIKFLRDLWLQGIRFDHIVLLSGERILDQYQELDLLVREGVALQDLPATETEMMVKEFEQAELPAALLTLSRTLVAAPYVVRENSTIKRPTTADTLHTWLQHNPKPGTVLAFSNQPCCIYQHVVARTILPTYFLVETVSDKVSERVFVGEYLDTLTRTLYQAYTSGYQEVEPLLH